MNVNLNNNEIKMINSALDNIKQIVDLHYITKFAIDVVTLNNPSNILNFKQKLEKEKANLINSIKERKFSLPNFLTYPLYLPLYDIIKNNLNSRNIEINIDYISKLVGDVKEIEDLWEENDIVEEDKQELNDSYLKLLQVRDYILENKHRFNIEENINDELDRKYYHNSGNYIVDNQVDKDNKNNYNNGKNQNDYSIDYDKSRNYIFYKKYCKYKIKYFNLRNKLSR